MKKTRVFIFFIFLSLFCSAQTKESAIDDSCLQIEQGISTETDAMHIYCNCEIVKFHIDIYNRHGKLLFKSDAINSTYASLSTQEKSHYTGLIDWNFERSTEETYNYTVKYTVKVNGKEANREKTGLITYIK